MFPLSLPFRMEPGSQISTSLCWIKCLSSTSGSNAQLRQPKHNPSVCSQNRRGRRSPVQPEWASARPMSPHFPSVPHSLVCREGAQMQLCSTYGGRILLMLCLLCYFKVSCSCWWWGQMLSALPLFDSHLPSFLPSLQLSLGLLLHFKAEQTFSPGEKQLLDTRYLGPVL